jgi:flagellar hook-length control protein FliK
MASVESEPKAEPGNEFAKDVAKETSRGQAKEQVKEQPPAQNDARTVNLADGKNTAQENPGEAGGAPVAASSIKETKAETPAPDAGDILVAIDIPADVLIHLQADPAPAAAPVPPVAQPIVQPIIAPITDMLAAAPVAVPAIPAAVPTAAEPAAAPPAANTQAAPEISSVTPAGTANAKPVTDAAQPGKPADEAAAPQTATQTATQAATQAATQNLPGMPAQTAVGDATDAAAQQATPAQAAPVEPAVAAAAPLQVAPVEPAVVAAAPMNTAPAPTAPSVQLAAVQAGETIAKPQAAAETKSQAGNSAPESSVPVPAEAPAVPQQAHAEQPASTDERAVDAAQPEQTARVETPHVETALPKPAPQAQPASVTNMAVHGAQAATQPQAAAPAASIAQHVEVSAEAARPNATALAVEVSARSQSGARQFDIRLDPPELGRVEVRLSIDAAGKASAHLTADQPQTLDLLQKDATVLTRALRDAGLDVSQNSLNFSLRHQNHDGGAHHGHARGASRGMTLTATQSIEATPASTAWRGDGRVDIRV